MIGMLYKKVVEEGEEEAGEILNYSNPWNWNCHCV